MVRESRQLPPLVWALSTEFMEAVPPISPMRTIPKEQTNGRIDRLWQYQIYQ
jgi:hypothetical protein